MLKEYEEEQENKRQEPHTDNTKQINKKKILRSKVTRVKVTTTLVNLVEVKEILRQRDNNKEACSKVSLVWHLKTLLIDLGVDKNL